jgi:hypothetical protein
MQETQTDSAPPLVLWRLRGGAYGVEIDTGADVSAADLHAALGCGLLLLWAELTCDRSKPQAITATFDVAQVDRETGRQVECGTFEITGEVGG